VVENAHNLKRFDRRIWMVAVSQLFNATGFSICFPFLSLYLYQERGIPMSLVGIMFLVSGCISGMVQLFSGALTDRLGRRPVILSGLGVRTILNLIMAFLISQNASVYFIALTYIGGQAADSIVRPASAALVLDIAPKGETSEAYGILRVGQNAGWAAGPAIGGYLATSFSYGQTFLLAPITNLIALALLWSVKETHHGDGKHTGPRGMFAAVRNRKFLVFVIIAMVLSIVMGQLGSTLSVFTVDRLGFSEANYGLLLTTNGLVVILFQYLIAHFTSKLPRANALTIGSLCYALGYLSFSWINNLGLAIPAIVLVTLGEVIIAPTTLATVGDFADKNNRGRYMGLYGVAEMLGFSLGPVVGGILLDGFTSPLPIWGTIGLIAFLAALGFQWWRGLKNG
jgi:MFS family permease